MISKNSFITLISLLIIELLSFFSFQSSIFHSSILAIILLTYLITTWKSREVGLLIIAAELILGSQGRLFSANIFNFPLSLRIGLFVIFILIWLLKDYKKILQSLKKDKIFLLSLLSILIFISIGLINSLLNKIEFIKIFNDLNGYLFFGLLFPIISLKNELKNLVKFKEIILSIIGFAIFKSLFFLYIFSHDFGNFSFDLYKWIRDTRIGEITRVSLDFSFHRVFLQSQIISALLIPFFTVLNFFNQKRNYLYFLTGCFAVLITSFSRANWLGVFLATGLTFLILLFTKYNDFKYRVINLSKSFGMILLGFILFFIIIFFPLPNIGSLNFDNLLDRATNLNGEAAVSSRWKMLPPLIESIKKAPIFGHGFGTEIEYLSDDPRIKTIDNPTGKNITSSFEWGYLDTITETGFIGLFIQLTLILSLIYKIGLKIKKTPLFEGLSGLYAYLPIIVGLLVIHAFSPYLNHPLGAGIILLGVYFLMLDVQETSTI